MTYMLDGKEVEITDTEFSPDEGVQVISACFAGSGEELTDDQCIELGDTYQSELYESYYVDMCAQAYDRAKDMWKYGE